MDLLGSELRLTDPQGDPLELVAWVVWDEAGRCDVERPCLPERRPTEAVIRSDGWLEVTVKDSAAVPEWSGVTRPTPTLVVADLLLLEDPLALYDLAAPMA